jgi:hypothetical protein
LKLCFPRSSLKALKRTQSTLTPLPDFNTLTVTYPYFNTLTLTVLVGRLQLRDDKTLCSEYTDWGKYHVMRHTVRMQFHWIIPRHTLARAKGVRGDNIKTYFLKLQ